MSSNTDRSRAIRQARRDRGVCIVCAKERPRVGFASCQACSDRSRAESRARYRAVYGEPTPSRQRGRDLGPRVYHCTFCGVRGHQMKSCPDPRAKTYKAEEAARMRESD